MDSNLEQAAKRIERLNRILTVAAIAEAIFLVIYIVELILSLV